jgi:hypothetical protein
MQREVIWRSDDGIGAEYLFLEEDASGIVADSVVLATSDVVPSRTHYRATLDTGWRIRELSIMVENAGQESRSLQLQSDGEGHWRNAAGTPLPDLDGCLDIDISATPFTNTLPIRRLALQPGQVESIRVLYIHVPTLEIEPWDQRYTGLAPGLVRYESLASGFQRDLTIDDDGLVVDYPDLFTRVWTSSD